MSLYKILPGCPNGCRHLIYVIATVIGWTILRGPTEVADVFHVVWLLPSCFRWTRFCMIGWTIPHGSTRIERCPEACNLSQCCFIFLHNTDTNMLCRLFDDRKYMDIYLTILQEYCYFGKQKNSLYFSASTCEHLWPSPSNLVNCAKCSHNPSKDAADWSLVADFKRLLNFKFLLLKIWFSQTSPFVDM